MNKRKWNLPNVNNKSMPKKWQNNNNAVKCSNNKTYKAEITKMQS